MSGGQSCQCHERNEPLLINHDRPNRPLRMWRVLARNVNHSAFNGYRATYSDWSLIKCLRCGAHWRTKANYVEHLDDATQEDRDRPGHNTVEIDGRNVRGVHAAYMCDMGREPYRDAQEG